MKNIEKEIYLTPHQAADYFNLSLSTIKNYIYAGKLKTLRTPGGHHRISKSVLLSAFGEVPDAEGDVHDAVIDNLCRTLLNLFKTFGDTGNYFILHSQHVSSTAYNLSRAMAMPEIDAKKIKIAGLLHDVGHLGVDRAVVLKKGQLTHDEYEAIKQHVSIGVEMLSYVSGLKDISEIIGQHHERMDGLGYPRRLRGERIRIESRIIAIIEAYDTMVSESFYKRATLKEIAVKELIENSASQFDEDIVRVFIHTL